MRAFGAKPPRDPADDFAEKARLMWRDLKEIMSQVKADFLWYRRITGEKTHNDQYTLAELIKRDRVRTELLKFIPYSIIFGIPGGSLLLPVYMLIFPNSTPDYFMTTEKRALKAEQLASDQKKAVEELKQYLQQWGLLAKYETALSDPLTSDYEAKIYNFLMKERERLLIHKLSSAQLELICQSLHMDYLPGYRIPNTVYTGFVKGPFLLAEYIQKKRGSKTYNMITDNFICKFNFTFDSEPLSSFKSWLLRLQIRTQLRHVRDTDLVALKNVSGLEELETADLRRMVHQRGGVSEGDRQQDLDFMNKWLRKQNSLPFKNKENMYWPLLLERIRFDNK
jgi:hypothetical protein